MSLEHVRTVRLGDGAYWHLLDLKDHVLGREFTDAEVESMLHYGRTAVIGDDTYVSEACLAVLPHVCDDGAEVSDRVWQLLTLQAPPMPEPFDSGLPFDSLAAFARLGAFMYALGGLWFTLPEVAAMFHDQGVSVKPGELATIFMPDGTTSEDAAARANGISVNTQALGFLVDKFFFDPEGEYPVPDGAQARGEGVDGE